MDGDLKVTMRRQPLLSRILAGTAAITRMTVLAVDSHGHGGDSDPALVHACVHQVSKQVRIIEADATYTKAESPMHWDVRGENGLQGTEGPPGPQGPAGPTGPQG